MRESDSAVDLVGIESIEDDSYSMSYGNDVGKSVETTAWVMVILVVVVSECVYGVAIWWSSCHAAEIGCGTVTVGRWAVDTVYEVCRCRIFPWFSV